MGFLLGLCLGLFFARSTAWDWLSVRLRRARSPSAFDNFDTSDLLLNLPLTPTSSWGNLGDWSQSSDYPEAARQLARRLAKAAELKAGARICDIGFGCGDQIRLWREEFDVGYVWGLNPSHSQFRLASERLAAEIRRAEVRLDCKSHLALGQNSDTWDHILALDCAYHFSEKAHFLQLAAARLQPGGSLVLTDLILAPMSAPVRTWLKLFTSLAGIPRANLCLEEAYRQIWHGAGFEIEIEDLSAEVFPGIAEFLERFLASWQNSLRPAVQTRYRATAAMARWAQRSGQLRYVLVKAKLRTP